MKFIHCFTSHRDSFKYRCRRRGLCVYSALCNNLNNYDKSIVILSLLHVSLLSLVINAILVLVDINYPKKIYNKHPRQ